MHMQRTPYQSWDEYIEGILQREEVSLLLRENAIGAIGSLRSELGENFLKNCSRSHPI